MPIEIFHIDNKQRDAILYNREGHFLEFKAKEIVPSKITRTISAFANADGGELYVGIAEPSAPLLPFIWNGFAKPEDANAHIQVFDRLFPLGHDYSYNFLQNADSPGVVLQVIIKKTRMIVDANDGIPRVRRNAQNIPYDTPTLRALLERNKGITSYENEPVNTDIAKITNSDTAIQFIKDVVPTREPEAWLRQNELIKGDKPVVAGVVLFSDLPQALLPKHTGIKIYQYQTSSEEGERDELVGDPITIEGSAYDLIRHAVNKTQEIISGIKVLGTKGLEPAVYPVVTLHEVITNAVLHRDYFLADDIHVRIFNNRVEVQSPGKLPAHMTIDNLLRERFSRNGNIVRVINKFPNPPNKDVGEGLNTAVNAMRELRLKDPVFFEKDNSFIVQINHQKLATPETLVMEFLENNAEITNRVARQLTGIKSENSMKKVFIKLRDRNMIEQIPGRSGFSSAWRKIAGA